MRHGTFALEESEKAGGADEGSYESSGKFRPEQCGSNATAENILPDSNTLATNIIFKPFF